MDGLMDGMDGDDMNGTGDGEGRDEEEEGEEKKRRRWNEERAKRMRNNKAITNELVIFQEGKNNHFRNSLLSYDKIRREIEEEFRQIELQNEFLGKCKFMEKSLEEERKNHAEELRLINQVRLHKVLRKRKSPNFHRRCAFLPDMKSLVKR